MGIQSVLAAVDRWAPPGRRLVGALLVACPVLVLTGAGVFLNWPHLMLGRVLLLLGGAAMIGVDLAGRRRRPADGRRRRRVHERIERGYGSVIFCSAALVGLALLAFNAPPSAWRFALYGAMALFFLWLAAEMVRGWREYLGR